MCVRFTQKLTWHQIHDLYNLTAPTVPLSLQPRYNGAPGQEFAACRLDGDGNRTIVQLRWGLVPVLRKKEDWPEAAERSRSRTRNQRRIDFLRRTKPETNQVRCARMNKWKAHPGFGPRGAGPDCVCCHIEAGTTAELRTSLSRGR